MSGSGLYVHVPFCLTRCGYCDFNTYAGLDHLQGRYVRALRGEASLWASRWAGESFVSMFLGGGTPTTLPLEDLRELMADLLTTFAFVDEPEITVESNPDTVDEAYLEGLLEADVTRMSFGLQSFDPIVLVSLERIHTAEAARAAYAAARRAGFENVNLDLIYGANGETLVSWQRTVEETVALAPEHVSAYALTIEPATALGRKVAAGLVPPPDPDLHADMYDAACSLLGKAGYEHYEVSNWAKPGHRCVHNMGYWEGRSYLGLGAGAHSYRDGTRWWNVRPPQQYLDMVEVEALPIGGEERLSHGERQMERLLLGLRVADGVPTEWLDGRRADAFVADGLAMRVEGRLKLSERGLFLANELVLDLAGSD